MSHPDAGAQRSRTGQNTAALCHSVLRQAAPPLKALSLPFLLLLVIGFGDMGLPCSSAADQCEDAQTAQCTSNHHHFWNKHYFYMAPTSMSINKTKHAASPSLPLSLCLPSLVHTELVIKISLHLSRDTSHMF